MANCRLQRHLSCTIYTSVGTYRPFGKAGSGYNKNLLTIAEDERARKKLTLRAKTISIPSFHLTLVVNVKDNTLFFFCLLFLKLRSTSSTLDGHIVALNIPVTRYRLKVVEKKPLTLRCQGTEP